MNAKLDEKVNDYGHTRLSTKQATPEHKVNPKRSITLTEMQLMAANEVIAKAVIHDRKDGTFYLTLVTTKRFKLTYTTNKLRRRARLFRKYETVVQLLQKVNLSEIPTIVVIDEI